MTPINETLLTGMYVSLKGDPLQWSGSGGIWFFDQQPATIIDIDEDIFEVDVTLSSPAPKETKTYPMTVKPTNWASEY